ncbi:MAG: Rrf2 family transcriptional regulator [Gemmatimonadetes bacterium]|nr:Rrf2 family transcriptional regulator [Gemmatimonadota bacterium]
MWLSSTAQHAIRAVLYLAERSAERPVRVDEIADALDCPRNYLSKTLHALTRAGVLRSERGPKGGFQLIDPPRELPIARVIAPFEPVAQRRCLFGRPECGGKHPCTAHHRWSGVATGVEDFFARTTVADLITEAAPKAAPKAARRKRPTRPPNSPTARRT